MPEQDTATATTEGTDTTTPTDADATNVSPDETVDLSFEAPKPATETTPDPTEGTTPDADEGAPAPTVLAEKADAKKEPDAQPEPEPEPSEPEFDDTLLREARQRGFSDGQAKAFQDPDRLRDAMTAMDRQLMGNFQPAVQQPQQVPVAQPPPQPQSASVEAPPPEFKVDLDPENFDAALIDHFKKMNAYYQGHVTNMQQALGEIIGQVQGESVLGKVQRFDDYVGTLGVEYESLMGKGTVDEIDPRSTEYATRTKVFQAMGALQNGYHQNRQAIPGERELFNRALRMVVGEQVASIERKKINGKVEKRSKQVTHRPTQRKAAPATDLESAIAAVKGIARDRSIKM